VITPGKPFKEFGSIFVKEHGPVYFGAVGSTSAGANNGLSK
jgi:hypothetical protein